MNQHIRTLLLIWLGWAITLIAFQEIVPARISLQRPDYAVTWTPNETRANSQDNKPYLLVPFMNAQASWDSEFYISIASMGYDDPNLRSVRAPNGERVSLNYAFFPLYPFVVRVVGIPFRLFGMKAIASSTIAGVLVSLLGTLAAMIALWDLVRDTLGDDGGIRAAFYLLIFPTGFFLAQVYTEGLFVGLAFGSLALIHRKYFLWAAILAALAVWTRAVGVALILPLVWGVISDHRSRQPSLRSLIVNYLCACAPLFAYLVWRFSPLGTNFLIVEESFFGRELFALGKSFASWGQVIQNLQSEILQRRVYYWLEFLSVCLALAACLFTLRRYTAIALFSLLAVLIAVTSGQAQSMIRYMLVVPSLYIFLSGLGRHQSFDRAWTTASVLLMGLLVTLFTFDMWVA